MNTERVGRRDFLKLSGLLGGAAGLELLGVQPVSAAKGKPRPSPDNWIPTSCNMCGGTTGVLARVVNGRVVKIEPNSENPVGLANIYDDFVSLKSTGARMCPKGNAAIMSLYDPDRIKAPLKRAGSRGSGQWQQISYEQALNEITQKLLEIRAEGPEKLLWFSEDNSFVAIQKSFCNAFGTPNFHLHSSLCDVARQTGFSTVMGVPRPLPDLRNTRYMLIFGWNPLGAMKWAHLPRILLDGLANGAKLVMVDPRCSETAEKTVDFSGEWLPIRPGTDGALALAMAHVIVAGGLYDAAFVQNYTTGFAQFSAFVADKTPEWAESITGIPASTITRIAREVATTKPAVIDAWSGPAQHTNGTQAIRAIAMLAGLLGQVDQPGTLIFPERPHLEFTIPPPPASMAPRIDGRGDKYPLAHDSGVYIEARDAMISGQPYKPRAAFFVFQNFVMAVPNTAKNLQALNELELIVSVDTHMSETALMADYVIPGSNFLERYELVRQWVTFPVVSLRQPAVPPVFGQKLEYEFVQDLGQRLGFRYPFNAPYQDYLDEALRAGIGISLAELKALPGATWIGGRTHYRKYETEGFHTPSGKLEFYSSRMAENNLNPLPDYVPPQDVPTNDFPFYLINWKEALHTHSRTMNNRWLMEFHGENELWINLDAAAARGIRDGDMVVVENQFARAAARARVTARIHPDVVGMVHGFGHWALGPVAKGKGINDAQFIPGKADPISGMAAHKEAAVRVYKQA